MGKLGRVLWLIFGILLIISGIATMFNPIETVLILAYENLQIANEIKDSAGNYYMLESITGNAKNNSTLNLSREPKKSLDKIRDIGNYSAHNIYYNATKKDIDDISTLYRLVMEELYYKAGLMEEGMICVS